MYGGVSSLPRGRMNEKCEGRVGLMPISGNGVPAGEEMANANALRDEMYLVGSRKKSGL